MLTAAAYGPPTWPSFQAQASTNLVNWVTLTNCLTLTNGMVAIADPASTNCRLARFYRILEP